MRHLTLIRHSVPEVRPDEAAARWPLSPEGLARARGFAARLEPGNADRVFTSAEPKAAQTARVLADVWTLPVEEVEGLHEHERPDVRLMPRERFEAHIHDMLERPTELLFGAETADAARLRFTDAVLQLVRRTDRDLLIVSHGTVIALFAAAHAGVDPFEFWMQQEMPSAITFALPDLTLEPWTRS